MAAVSVIELVRVTKEYRLGELQNFKQRAQNLFSDLRGKPLQRRALFKALDDVDLSVAKGDVLGIIGPNGSGKSTLLKLLARISTPTRGVVTVTGTVAPLIEVGAGLVRELTGRENIYLNAAILGMRSAEVTRRFDEIVAFSELHEFIDTPIKHYSSGMSMRLAFSIATSVNADILIVDEVLAVGDLTFQRKCFDRMEDMIRRQGKTVLLVSHNIRQIERLCNRVVLLDHGRIIADGAPATVCDLFFEQSDARIRAHTGDRGAAGAGRQQVSGEVDLTHVSLHGLDARPVEEVPYRSDVTIVMRYRFDVSLDEVTFGIGVHTTDFLYLTTHNSEQQLLIKSLGRGEHEIRIVIRQFPLLPGVYSIRVGVTAGMVTRPVFYAENVLQFRVVGRPEDPIVSWMREGFLQLDASWEGLGEPISADRIARIDVRDRDPADRVAAELPERTRQDRL
jgi:lipopolysaccharide transport system ATP-binding protein